MSGGRSLLEGVQGLLRRTYRLRADLEAGRFVIGDSGFRELYGGGRRPGGPSSAGGSGARTLLRETPEGLRACIYYPDRLIERLEAYPPQRGLRDENVEAFATLVEELDHLLCIADGAERGRSLSLFELELHANVSKHLVLARFLAGRAGRLSARRRTWLRYHLFEKQRYCDDDPAVRQRYRDAARWAVRFLDRLAAVEPARRIELLRRFHARTATGKLRLIATLAA